MKRVMSIASLMILVTLALLPTCNPENPSQPKPKVEPLTLDEMTRRLQGWRLAIADRRSTIWLQKSPVDSALQRLDFLIAGRIETLKMARQRKEGDPRRDELARAIGSDLTDWTHRLKHFEGELKRAAPIVEAFNIVRSAVAELTFLEEAGVNVQEVHASVRESANLHREARKLWFDQLRLTLEGEEPDPLLIQSGLATASRALAEARPIQARLSRIKTSVIQRQNVRHRTAGRIEWALGFLKSLEAKHPFHAVGIGALNSARESHNKLSEEGKSLDKAALDPSRDFEKRVRDHRFAHAAVLHDINVTFLTQAKKAGWPLPR